MYVNIYDLFKHNNVTKVIGMGAFHSGIQVFGQEFSFAGHQQENVTGILISTPKDCSIPGVQFRESIHVGVTYFTKDEVFREFLDMADEFEGPSYNVLLKNCNNFSESFLKRLLSGSHGHTFDSAPKDILPNYVNRAARVARNCRSCMPEFMQKDIRELRFAPQETTYYATGTDTASHEAAAAEVAAASAHTQTSAEEEKRLREEFQSSLLFASAKSGDASSSASLPATAAAAADTLSSSTSSSSSSAYASPSSSNESWT